MRFSCEKFSKPFGVPVKTSRGTFPYRESLVVRIEDAFGDSSCGEIAPWDGFGCETLADAEAFLQSCGPCVPDEIPESLPCTAHAFSAAKFFLENPDCRNASGPQQRLCAKLIRRSREDSPEKILEEIARERVTGFSVFKIKIGLEEQAAELNFCEKILCGVPAGTRVRFDANGAFSAEALPRLAELSNLPGTDFFEQPLPPSPKNDEKIFEFSGATEAKFALDESVRDPWAFPCYTRVVAVVKPLLVSDFRRLLAWLENSHGADVVISTVFENSSAGTDALRLACSRIAENRRRPFGLG
ncbi:MAG: hypothetical protein IJN19_06750 [Opitutales bacterium]|nr:hypothetical protein [Opitutales bacterium]